MSREYHLLKKFGITVAQYEELLAKQGGTCALCDKTAEMEGRFLAVDHDHVSGEVRGILCAFHNHRVVGRHRDSDLLRRMADYLDNGHTGWFVPPKTRKRKTKAGAVSSRSRKVKA